MFPTRTRHIRRLQRRLAALRQPRQRRDTGAFTVEVISWAAMSVVAIVAIGGALQVLGLDIIGYVRSQLGV
jgi:hypothetical protein